MGQRINTNLLKINTKHQNILTEWYSKQNLAMILYEDIYLRKFLFNYNNLKKKKIGNILIKRTILNELYIIYNIFHLKKSIIQFKKNKKFKFKKYFKKNKISKKKIKKNLCKLKKLYILKILKKLNLKYKLNLFLKKKNLNFSSLFFLILKKNLYNNNSIKKQKIYKNFLYNMLYFIFLYFFFKKFLKKKYKKIKKIKILKILKKINKKKFLKKINIQKPIRKINEKKIFFKKINKKKLILNKIKNKKNNKLKKFLYFLNIKKKNNIKKKYIINLLFFFKKTIHKNCILIKNNLSLQKIYTIFKSPFFLKFKQIYCPFYIKKLKNFEYFYRISEITHDISIFQNRLSLIFSKNYKNIPKLFKQFKFIFQNFSEFKKQNLNFLNLSEGIKIQFIGKCKKAARSKMFTYFKGKLALQKFNSNLQYKYSQVKNKFGTNGIHFWLNFISKNKLFYYYYYHILLKKKKLYKYLYSLHKQYFFNKQKQLKKKYNNKKKKKIKIIFFFQKKQLKQKKNVIKTKYYT